MIIQEKKTERKEREKKKKELLRMHPFQEV